MSHLTTFEGEIILLSIIRSTAHDDMQSLYRFQQYLLAQFMGPV